MRLFVENLFKQHKVEVAERQQSRKVLHFTTTYEFGNVLFDMNENVFSSRFILFFFYHYKRRNNKEVIYGVGKEVKGLN